MLAFSDMMDSLINWERNVYKTLSNGEEISDEIEEMISLINMDSEWGADALDDEEISESDKLLYHCLARLKDTTRVLSQASPGDRITIEYATYMIHNIFYAGYFLGKASPTGKYLAVGEVVSELEAQAKHGLRFNNSGQKGKSELTLRLEVILREHYPNFPTWRSIITKLNDNHSNILLYDDPKQDYIVLKNDEPVSYKNFRNRITEAKHTINKEKIPGYTGKKKKFDRLPPP